MAMPDTNTAYDKLVSGPLRLGQGEIRIAHRTEHRADLGCLLIRPALAASERLVGVVGGTGLKGMRLTERLPYFLSGVGYPDWIVLGPDTLTKGSAGVLGAGFFGPDWGVADGDFAWQAERSTSKRSAFKVEWSIASWQAISRAANG